MIPTDKELAAKLVADFEGLCIRGMWERLGEES